MLRAMSAVWHSATPRVTKEVAGLPDVRRSRLLGEMNIFGRFDPDALAIDVSGELTDALLRNVCGGLLGVWQQTCAENFLAPLSQ